MMYLILVENVNESDKMYEKLYLQHIKKDIIKRFPTRPTVLSTPPS